MARYIDVQEVKHGFYEGKKMHVSFRCKSCSICGLIVPIANYCMWCGAKMELKGEKNDG